MRAPPRKNPKPETVILPVMVTLKNSEVIMGTGEFIKSGLPRCELLLEDGKFKVDVSGLIVRIAPEAIQLVVIQDGNKLHQGTDYPA